MTKSATMVLERPARLRKLASPAKPIVAVQTTPVLDERLDRLLSRAQELSANAAQLIARLS